MNALDYLKRGFSAVFHEDKIFRTILASFGAAGAIATGYGTAMYEEAETTSTVSAAQQQETRTSYLKEIQSFKAPDIAGPDGWDKLDRKMKDFSERVVLDTKLSETDASSIMADFKASTRFRPPQYMWMVEKKNGSDVGDMNYLNECRAETSAQDPSLYAQRVYACAVDKEDNNETAVALPAVFGGIATLFTFLVGGASLGRRWENEFDRKKHDEEWERERAKRDAERAVRIAEEMREKAAREAEKPQPLEEEPAAQEKPAAKTAKPSVKLNLD